MIRSIAALCFWVLACPALSVAEERILDFHSDIFVASDATMRVVETITVVAEGDRIQRGIYRDFPTTYTDQRGHRYRVGFEVVEVTRNGHPEPWFLKSISNGVRVYIGRKEHLIVSGQHTYTITYTTNRQLGFFDAHDELYWNVTGLGWAFPIERASARVELPDGIAPEDIRTLGFTGAYGSKAQNLISGPEASSLAWFETTAPLGPHEGLTIVTMWPTGFVEAPTSRERFGYLMKDNRHLLAGAVGFAVLVGYYLLAWFRVGRDPEPGIVYARYRPPEDYSPAAVRFIRKMGYDAKCFSAALVNLAVKGHLVIAEDGRSYSLTRRRSDQPVTRGESRILAKVFADGPDIGLKNTNHHRISTAMEAHKEALKDEYERKYFLRNVAYFAGGVLITLVMAASVVLAGIKNGLGGEQAAILLWLTVWMFATVPLVWKAVRAWRHAHGFRDVIGALALSAFAVPFVTAALVVYFSSAGNVPLSLKLLIVATIAVNFVFYHWLKAPTHLGRELLDEVEGFREYVEIAEKQELDYRYPGGRSPELFEKYLPYAIALDIEQTWGDQFSDVLAAAGAKGEAYTPAWYSGTDFTPGRAGSFANAMGNSMASAASSASSPPGSSSGGGGGGFSGGGGGGGGGGGW